MAFFLDLWQHWLLSVLDKKLLSVLDKKVTLCIRQKKLLSVLHKKSTMAFLSYMVREPQRARILLHSNSFVSSLIKENPPSLFVLFFILSNFNFFTYD